MLACAIVACSATETPPESTDGAVDTSIETPADEAVEPAAPIHPAFDLTIDELRAIVGEMDAVTRVAVDARPQVFLEYVARLLETDPDLLLLVDKNNSLETGYEPGDLRDLAEYRDRLTLTRDGLSLREIVLPDLLAMSEAAAVDGVRLDISSTYRSYSYQDSLFDYWVAELGLAQAERVSARPGTSQHQLGTTVDFGTITVEYADAPGGLWLADNAWRFGFSLSYPRDLEPLTGYVFEPWHYRFVSRDATFLEREFFGSVQQTMLEFWHKRAESFRERYRPDRAS